MKGSICKLFASGFGSGYSPVAPGTAGSLLAALLLIPTGYPEAGLWQLDGKGQLWLLAGVVVFFIIGVWSANQLEGEWGKDPSRVVIDEMVGMWIAMLWVVPSWPIWIAAFLLFRVFDIFKPLFIRDLERLPGGWGVMMDDVLAGVYTNLILQIGVYFFYK